MDDAIEIFNLLYRYAELIDSGELESAADLFRDATLTSRGEQGEYFEEEHEHLLARWRAMIKIYPSGRPETKHVITNPILEVDGNTATCRSYYTVLQQVGDGPLAVLAAGRYHDRFERVGGHWRYKHRDYTLMDLRGDLSNHLELSLFRPRETSV